MFANFTKAERKQRKLMRHLRANFCLFSHFVQIVLTEKEMAFFLSFFYTFMTGNSDCLTRVKLHQPQERYLILQVHAGSFRVSVIHQTRAWTILSVHIFIHSLWPTVRLAINRTVHRTRSGMVADWCGHEDTEVDPTY